MIPNGQTHIIQEKVIDKAFRLISEDPINVLKYGLFPMRKRSDGFGQLFQTLTDDTYRIADVQTHETFAPGTEHLAVIQCQIGFVNEQIQ